MTKIFSSVVAKIDNEFATEFPADFDYLAMINKVSEEAGVVVHENGGSDISLEGGWVTMDRVHRLLASTLSVYGVTVKCRDIPEDKEKHSCTDSYNIGSGCQEILKRNFDFECHKQPDSNNLLVDTQSNEECDLSVKLKNSEHSFGIDDYKVSSSLSPESGETDKSWNESSSPKLKMKVVKRKRGRPRKNATDVQSQPFSKSKYKSKLKQRKKYKKRKCKSKPVKEKPVISDVEHNSDSEYPCADCDYIAYNKNTIKDHKQRVHLSSPTACEICQKVFPNHRYMKRHLASHVEPQHCCDVCGKMYKIRKAMLEHKKTHEEGYSRPSFPCDLCPKSFCSSYILSQHVKSEHLGQRKSFLCSVCGKSFTTKHSLQEHLNAHTGSKPHVCEVCGKAFSYESALRDHKFVHVGSKQFVCQVCSKAFTQRSGLVMHLRIHKETKQYMCSDCGREFTQKQALQRHERVHKGDKPFSCRLCNRTFSDSSIIRRHLILVHKIHKDAKTWREDIISKVEGAQNYHVEKVSDQNSKTPSKTFDNEVSGTKGLLRSESDTICDQSSSSSVQKDSRTTDFRSHVQTPENSDSLKDGAGHFVPPHKEITTPYPEVHNQQSKEFHSLENPNEIGDMRQSAPFYNEAESISPPNSANIQNGQHNPAVGPVDYHPHDHFHPDTSHPKSTDDRTSSSYPIITSTGNRQFFSLENSDGATDTRQSNSADEPFYHGSSRSNIRLPTSQHTHPINAPSLTPVPNSDFPMRGPNNGNNLPTSSPQSWSSMYAYYSSLASQFGMTLSDYPNIPNHRPSNM